jgi:hypothetical protein
MKQEERKSVEEKKEWSKPILTVLVVDSMTNGIPNGNALNDGLYS